MLINTSSLFWQTCTCKRWRTSDFIFQSTINWLRGGLSQENSKLNLIVKNRN